MLFVFSILFQFIPFHLHLSYMMLSFLPFIPFTQCSNESLCSDTVCRRESVYALSMLLTLRHRIDSIHVLPLSVYCPSHLSIHSIHSFSFLVDFRVAPAFLRSVSCRVHGPPFLFYLRTVHVLAHSSSLCVEGREPGWLRRMSFEVES